MELTILAASGATGRELTRQALERGHIVKAIARDPDRIAAADCDRLTRVAADVRDPESIALALHGSAVVLSGLGVAKGDEPGALTVGARALVAARPGPGPGPRPPPRPPPRLFSMMVIVAELTLDVMIRFRSSDTKIMWVRFWPVPSTQSTFFVAGS